tara:strand:- start:1354 stop:1530 length:177 start_codon:yes stop_codon:yes gene_type:complete
MRKKRKKKELLDFAKERVQGEGHVTDGHPIPLVAHVPEEVLLHVVLQRLDLHPAAAVP